MRSVRGREITEATAIARKRWFDHTPVGKEGVTERYVIFGESRRWLVDQLDLRESMDVLDLGAGHGFLSYELASRTKSRITALDVLSGEARVELLDVVEAKPFGKVIDFGSLWKRYGERIGRIGLAYPRVLSVTAYKRVAI